MYYKLSHISSKYFDSFLFSDLMEISIHTNIEYIYILSKKFACFIFL